MKIKEMYTRILQKLLDHSEDKASHSVTCFENLLLNRNKKDVSIPPVSDKFMLTCLKDTFLSENWYTNYHGSYEQFNTIMLYYILYKHNKSFRRWYKKNYSDIYYKI